MTETICFVALHFDFVDGGYITGEPTECTSPAAAIQTAKGLWKVFGHTCALHSAARPILRQENSAGTMCFGDLGKCPNFRLSAAAFGLGCPRTSLQCSRSE